MREVLKHGYLKTEKPKEVRLPVYLCPRCFCVFCSDEHLIELSRYDRGRTLEFIEECPECGRRFEVYKHTKREQRRYLWL